MKLEQVKLTAQNLSASGNVAHGFFGMPKHDPEMDREAMFHMQCVESCAELEVAAHAHVHQVHGRDVVRVMEGQAGSLAQADAMVTDKPGIALIIKTADCAPVLLADPKAGIIGAAHAGWRGALAGVLEATLAAMEDMGAQRANIMAAIGPTIAQASYEVGAEFKHQFLAETADASRFFSDDFGPKPHFDLPGFCAGQLSRAGMTAVEVLPVDTRDEKQGFFSYRRSCQHPESRYGRNASVIALRKT